MSDFKELVGIIAVALTFIGYIPYLRDVVHGRTKPHIYSWFLWGFVTFIAFGLQVSAGGGIGAFVTLAASLMCITVFILGVTRNGKKDITRLDTVFFLLAFVALGLWLIAKQPVISIILTTAIDLLAFAPTIRKSWNKPGSETLSLYFLSTFRFMLAVFALQSYTFVTMLYPIAWIFGNGLFAAMLFIRRKQLSSKLNGG